MINSMREADAFRMTDIKILAMYGRQKVLISTMFFRELASKLGLRYDAFPSVYTADSFQSKEATMIVLDSTVTDDLGFVDHENRLTMACIRAKDAHP